MAITAAQVRALVGALPVAAPDEFWLAVHAAYAVSPRVYHCFDHVAAVAAHYRVVEEAVGWHQPAEVALAVLYHDAVYRVGAKTNERDSARLAAEHMARWLSDAEFDPARVVALIELTARHGSVTAADVDADAALFLDCDMAILGAPAEAYDRYAAQVAEEYAPIIPARAYASGRAQFLDKLLASERVFLSAFFHARLGAAARDNLRRERQRLGD